MKGIKLGKPYPVGTLEYKKEVLAVYGDGEEEQVDLVSEGFTVDDLVEKYKA